MSTGLTTEAKAIKQSIYLTPYLIGIVIIGAVSSNQFAISLDPAGTLRTSNPTRDIPDVFVLDAFLKAWKFSGTPARSFRQKLFARLL